MFETTEKRINKQYGTITYWKDGVMIGRRCTKCGEDKVINEFGFDGRKRHKAHCKECERKRVKEYRKNNIEKCRASTKKYAQENAEKMKEYWKQYRQEHLEHKKEINKKYREEHKEEIALKKKQYCQENREAILKNKKRYYQENKEKFSERKKQQYKENPEYFKERAKYYHELYKNEELQNLTNMLKQINPILKKLNLKAYGSVYKVTNIKTRRVYIGQTTVPLRKRYRSNVVKGWINERKGYENQKFLEELNEEDLKIEIIDVAVCQYHLDKLEAYWIDYYNSYNDGYNNNYGNYKTDDGLEEFEQILKENGLQFIDGKLVKIA